jgi:hypothetical protein
MSRMQRPEVYDGHVSVPFKKELEEAARSRETSVDNLLEQIVREWLERDQERTETDDEERQQRLRAAAAPFIGAIQGSDPTRSENVSSLVRARLVRKHGR